MSEKKEALSTPSYSWTVGSVYVFNLFLGAGLLSLPKAFAEVGLVLGLVSLGVLAMGSYITITFVIEAQSIYNAICRYRHVKTMEHEVKSTAKEGLSKPVIVSDTVLENNIAIVGYIKEMDVVANTGLIGDTIKQGNLDPTKKQDNCEQALQSRIEEVTDSYLYEITEKAEFGEMAKMFFNKGGVILYYIAICLYLYGGLSVYAAAVSKSLTTVVCGDANCFNGNDSTLCKNFRNSTVICMYRKMLAIFVVLVCPFIFFNLTKTKILQLSTMFFRWFALLSMIILAMLKIVQGNQNYTPRLFKFKTLPQFFGVALYTFMCQYSIPAVITPITNKKRLNLAVILVFISTLIFYVFILSTAVYAFRADELQDLYTLNFTHPVIFKYILELFPVFTLFTNFPILAIVLRENLKALFLSNGERAYGVFLRRILFPLVVTIPPIMIAYCTYNVGMLVGYTGAYAGAIIQYVVPTMLIYCSRKKAINTFDVYVNRHRSPFYHRGWICVVLLWYIICFVFVTYYKVAGR